MKKLNYANLWHKRFVACNNDFSAFTLAEMMVVLLIMSIILAAMAPVMTSKMRTDKNNNLGAAVWHWTKSDPTLAYLGLGGKEVAMIGQKDIKEGDNAKLILNNTEDADTNMITFKKKGNVLGNLFFSESKPLLSQGSTTILGAGSTSGVNNIAIGNAMMNNEGGHDNIAIGNFTLEKSTSSNSSSNIAIGHQALRNNETGYSNVVLGNSSLINNSTGSYNVALGNNSLISNTTGEHNTAIGGAACQFVKGSNKTCIGYGSGPELNHTWANDNKERIFIGSKSKFNGGPAALEIHNGIEDNGVPYIISSSRGIAKTVVVVNGALLVKGGIITSMPWVDDREFAGTGAVNLIGRTDGQLEPVNLDWQGSSNQVSGEFGREDRGPFKCPNSHNSFSFSDRRLKNVGKENTDGLAKLRQLKIFNYTFKKDTTKTPRVGVMAQDLQKVFPNAVKKADDGFLTIRMEDMFYALINAVKELDTKVTALTEQIKRHTEALAEVSRQNKELKETLRSTQNDIKLLRKENQELKKEINKLKK